MARPLAELINDQLLSRIGSFKQQILVISISCQGGVIQYLLLSVSFDASVPQLFDTYFYCMTFSQRSIISFYAGMIPGKLKVYSSSEASKVKESDPFSCF